MAITYEVKVTRQALEQMQEITHYIAHELYAPDAAYSLLENGRYHKFTYGYAKENVFGG